MSRLSMPAKISQPIEFRKLRKSGVRLFGYFKLQKLWLLLFASLMVISAVSDVLVPVFMGNIANYVELNFSYGFSLNSVLFYVLIVAMLHVLSVITSISGGITTALIGQNLVYRLRKDVKSKLDRLPLKYYDKNSRGDILSRINNDTDTIAATIQDTLGQVVFAFASIVSVAVMMFIISWALALVVLGFVPLYLLVSTPIVKKSRKLQFAQQTELGLLNGHIEEIYGGHKVVKLYSLEAINAEKFQKINEKLKVTSGRAMGISGILMPLLHFLGTLTFTAIVITGALLIGGQVPSLGIIITFIMFRDRFTNPINQVGNMLNQIQGALASSDRVFEILDEEEESE